jgi:ligand-binding SRPBCC domain-containing protein
MPRIELHTEIMATRNIVFDLARSIDLHKISTKHTSEEAIAGKTAGLIGINETVTWKAQHFGIYQNLTSKITAYKFSEYFVDEMVDGAFKSFRHEHWFSDLPDGTLMIDFFEYKSPYGMLGCLIDWLFLKRYLTNLLTIRNTTIKEFAEDDKHKSILAVVDL